MVSIVQEESLRHLLMVRRARHLPPAFLHRLQVEDREMSFMWEMTFVEMGRGNGRTDDK